MATRKKTDPLAAARLLALSGDAERAVAALTPLAGGDAGAAASLAELLAFRGQWAEVIVCARKLVANPGAVYAANVFDDMVRLSALAGIRGAPWESIAALAADGIASAAREPRPHLAGRRHTILEALSAYAARSGAPPHECIEVFGVVRAVPTKEQYEAAVAAAEKKPKPTPEAQTRHRIALAASFAQSDELVRWVNAAPAHASFAQVLGAARSLAIRGEAHAAWELIEAQLGAWSPVDRAQVAPVELLTDPTLRELITPARAAQVLATPRGAGRASS
jgi:hypothetical protein